MTAVASHILSLPGWVALLVVFAMPALESSAFVGFVFPGEIALILGGVIAYEGRVSLAAVLVAAIVGSVVGDSVGYAVGERYGRRLLDGTVGRFVKRSHLDHAQTYLAERGGKAVFLGRFTAALRVLIPGLAGMSRMPYPTFLAYNAASAVGWGTMSVMLGYLGGSSWRHVEHIASRIGLAALLTVVLAAVGGHLLRRTGPRGSRRLTDAVAGSRSARRLRARFPRLTAWLLDRFDQSTSTGLPLTTAVVVAVVAGWTFLGITQDVLAHEELAMLDPRVNAWVLAHRAVGLTLCVRAATVLGSNVVTVPLVVVVGGLLARRRRSWGPVADMVAVYASAALLRAVVATLVHRHRPPAAEWLTAAAGWAYPSGHATQALAAYGVLAVLLAVGLTRRTRLAVTVVAALLAVTTAASPVYLGVHWATDVLGGAALSVAVLGLWGIVRLTLLSPCAQGSAVEGQESDGEHRKQRQHDEQGDAQDGQANLLPLAFHAVLHRVRTP